MRRTFLFFCVVFSFSLLTNAQKPVQTIRGTVTDVNSQEKLFGANVVLVEKNQGTITDNKGQFILENIPVGRYQLQVSYIGYKPVVIPELLVKSGREVVLEIKMEASISELEEITVRPSIRKDRPVNSMIT